MTILVLSCRVWLRRLKARRGRLALVLRTVMRLILNRAGRLVVLCVLHRLRASLARLQMIIGCLVRWVKLTWKCLFALLQAVETLVLLRIKFLWLTCVFMFVLCKSLISLALRTFVWTWFSIRVWAPCLSIIVLTFRVRSNRFSSSFDGFLLTTVIRACTLVLFFWG